MLVALGHVALRPRRRDGAPGGVYVWDGPGGPTGWPERLDVEALRLGRGRGMPWMLWMRLS